MRRFLAIAAMLLTTTALLGAPSHATGNVQLSLPVGGPGWASVTVTVAQETQVRLKSHVTVNSLPLLAGYGNLVLTDGVATTLGWALINWGSPQYTRTEVSAGPIQIHESTEAPNQATNGAGLGVTGSRTLSAGTHMLVQFFAWTPAAAAQGLTLSVEGDDLAIDDYSWGPEAAMFQDRDFQPQVHLEDSASTDRYNVMALGEVPFHFSRSATAFLTAMGPPTRRGDDVFSINGPYTCPLYVHNLLLRGAPPGDYEFAVRLHATTDPHAIVVGPAVVFPIQVFTRPILLVADLPIPVQTVNVSLPVAAPCTSLPS